MMSVLDTKLRVMERLRESESAVKVRRGIQRFVS